MTISVNSHKYFITLVVTFSVDEGIDMKFTICIVITILTRNPYEVIHKCICIIAISLIIFRVWELC